MPQVIPEPYEGAFYTVRFKDLCDRVGANPFEDSFDNVFAVNGALAQSDYPQYYALKAKIVKLFRLSPEMILNRPSMLLDAIYSASTSVLMYGT